MQCSFRSWPECCFAGGDWSCDRLLRQGDCAGCPTAGLQREGSVGLRRGGEPATGRWCGGSWRDEVGRGGACLEHGRTVSSLTVIGLATDYCVKETVLDARRLGYGARVVLDCIAAVNLQRWDGAEALDAMRSAGAELV